MRVSGIMNAQLTVRLPANVSFESCKIIPITGHAHEGGSMNH
jgi:hypothetical protein